MTRNFTISIDVQDNRDDSIAFDAAVDVALPMGGEQHRSAMIEDELQKLTKRIATLVGEFVYKELRLPADSVTVCT